MDSDSEMEIAIGGYSSSGDVFAVNHDGSDIPGFPLQLNEKMWKGFAAHDFNNDGLDELVVTTDGDDLILVVYADGSTQILLEAGDKFKSSPSIIDVNGEYIWNIPKRSDSEWEAGVGKSTIISATKKYKKLIGKTCVYAISYYKDTFHTKTKC